MLVDPADIRFTQDSINLYFQDPHSHFSIRQVVRRISTNKMRPDEFPSIRVISYNGSLWSMDNRRLWVYRFARCKSISARVLKRMHHRLEELISNPDSLCMMEGADFYPRVRDRGQKDRDFDRLYPQPSSLKPSRNYDSQGHADNESNAGAASSQTPPAPSTARDHEKSGAARSQTLWDRFLSLWSAAMKKINGWFSRCRIFSLAWKITNASWNLLGRAVSSTRRFSSWILTVALIAVRWTVNTARQIINAIWIGPYFFH